MITTIIHVVIIIAAIAIGILCGVLGGSAAYNYLNQPSEVVLEKMAEWLIFAVAEAEKELGSGTGQLKLRYVYNMALEKFPKVIKYISFEKFSSLVDTALAKFKEMLKTNTSIQEYVETENKNS